MGTGQRQVLHRGGLTSGSVDSSTEALGMSTDAGSKVGSWVFAWAPIELAWAPIGLPPAKTDSAEAAEAFGWVLGVLLVYSGPFTINS